MQRIGGVGEISVNHVNFYGEADNYDEQMAIHSREIIPGLRAELATGAR